MSSLVAHYQSQPLLCTKGKNVLLQHAATAAEVAAFLDSLHRPYEEIQVLAGALPSLASLLLVFVFGLPLAAATNASWRPPTTPPSSHRPPRFPKPTPPAPEDRKATVSGDLLIARKRAASRAAAAAQPGPRAADPVPPPADPAPTRQAADGEGMYATARARPVLWALFFSSRVVALSNHTLLSS